MSIETSLSPVITVRALADYLRVHPLTVYRLLKHGLLPGFKVGSDWRFNREDIERWRLAQTSQSLAPAGIPAPAAVGGTTAQQGRAPSDARPGGTARAARGRRAGGALQAR